MSFPTMVYKSPGHHNAGHGKTFSFKGVNTQDQLDKALKTGWSMTKTDAIYGKKTEEVKKAQMAEEEKDKRKELEKEASKRGLEKGVHFDGRTSTEKLNSLLFEDN
jgi:hypothetical protein